MELANLSLPPDLEAFVQAKVSEGEYETTEEVVRAGLALLQERDRVRAERLNELRKQVEIGLSQLDRGECAELNMGEIREEVRRRIAAETSNG